MFYVIPPWRKNIKFWLVRNWFYRGRLWESHLVILWTSNFGFSKVDRTENKFSKTTTMNVLRNQPEWDIFPSKCIRSGSRNCTVPLRGQSILTEHRNGNQLLIFDGFKYNFGSPVQATIWLFWPAHLRPNPSIVNNSINTQIRSKSSHNPFSGKCDHPKIETPFQHQTWICSVNKELVLLDIIKTCCCFNTLGYCSHWVLIFLLTDDKLGVCIKYVWGVMNGPQPKI